VASREAVLIDDSVRNVRCVQVDNCGETVALLVSMAAVTLCAMHREIYNQKQQKVQK